MRVFKKIMYIILALVPIFPLLLFAVCNVGNANGVDVMPFGYLFIESYDDDNESMILVERDTLIYHFLSGMIPADGSVEVQDAILEEGEEGFPAGAYRLYIFRGTSNEPLFVNRIIGFYNWFSSVGLAPPLYVVLIFAYLCYMFFIHVCFMIFDLVVFVPRKISEMLEV